MILKNATIVLHNKLIPNGYLCVKNGVITDIQEGNYDLVTNEEVIDIKGNIILPGFIDLHTHGAVGVDFMNATKNDIEKVANQFYKEGITTFLLTTLTAPKEDLLKVAKTVKETIKDVPSLLGIHLEGPYISLKYKGAQNELYIRKADIKEIDELQKESGNLVKYITLAPEKDGSLEIIPELVKRNIVVSLGHSDSDFDTAIKAFNLGATNITHAHNAMSGYHHRNPGLLEAAMYDDNIYCEVISDRVHICDDTLKTFYKIIKKDRFMIITDSLSAKGLDTKEFELMGLPCETKNGAAYLKSGPLAGSLLKFNQGVKNLFNLFNLSLIDIATISSYNQAKSLKLHDRGEIRVGSLADLVIVDKDFNVLSTYKLGKKVY